ncbi:1,2-phenylacetyl-CoA epoxidase subunit PaaD [Actinacidiphila yeochonensis]|uniref:1,2-phenylacetyl-CoA epoxidase subunit PaaD n=1 Tax=Actinacidiphila yeochonensis TaxID=89050 RepID=UPI0038995F91
METETETEPETGAGAGAGAGTEAPTEADTEPGSGPEPGADPAGTVRESAARTASGATGGPYGGGRGPDDVHGPDGESGPDGGRETVVAEVTPTYSGCPAMAEMRADVAARLRAAGFSRVRVRTVLDPPWSTDLITAEGRRKLAAYGIAPPGPAPRRAPGPVPLELGAVRRAVPCPRCGSSATEETSHFSATACRSLWRCRACWEPFEHVKEV